MQRITRSKRYIWAFQIHCSTFASIFARNNAFQCLLSKFVFPADFPWLLHVPKEATLPFNVLFLFLFILFSIGDHILLCVALAYNCMIDYAKVFFTEIKALNLNLWSICSRSALPEPPQRRSPSTRVALGKLGPGRGHVSAIAVLALLGFMLCESHRSRQHMLGRSVPFWRCLPGVGACQMHATRPPCVWPRPSKSLIDLALTSFAGALCDWYASGSSPVC